MLTPILFTILTLLIILLSKRKSKYSTAKKLAFSATTYNPMGHFLKPTEFIDDCMRYTQQYGSVVRLRLGLYNSVLITDPKTLEQVLSNKKMLDKGFIYRFIPVLIEDGLLVSSGQKWQQRRRLITPAFHFEVLKNYVSTFHNHALVLTKKLEKEIGKDSFDLFPYITLYALDVICETAMDTPINAQIDSDSDYVKALKITLNIVMERILNPLYQLDWLFRLFKASKTQKKAVEVIHKFTESVIKQKRQQPKHPEKKVLGKLYGREKLKFIDFLFYGEIKGVPLNDFEIREEVDTFLFEGHDTSSSGISFALYCIAQHSQVQEKLMEEIESIFADDTARAPTYEEIMSMRYLDMVIKECLRLYPPVAMISRQLKEDTSVENYEFLKNDILILFLYGVMRNPEYFPEPDKFDPERFRPEVRDQRPIFSYLPFSAGERNCIGQKFSLLELKTAVSTILRHYKLLPAKPTHTLKLSSEIVLISKTGIKIRIEKRNS